MLSPLQQQASSLSGSLIAENMLVVENQQYLRDNITKCLARAGYQAVGVGTGAEALILAKSNRPGLMILESMLPDMSGTDVCRQIKQDHELQSMGIILTSARNEEQDIINGLDMGADDYILKPFSLHVLLARVRAVLQRSGAITRQVV